MISVRKSELRVKVTDLSLTDGRQAVAVVGSVSIKYVGLGAYESALCRDTSRTFTAFKEV